ncbi:MAG: hypothetical protein UHH87_03825 [Akkermansia sp.]|nr:hypothetical protein [Akkermansia sp.]
MEPHTHITLFDVSFADIGGLIIFWWACAKYGAFVGSHFKPIGSYLIMAISNICFWAALVIHHLEISLSVNEIVTIAVSSVLSIVPLLPKIVNSYIKKQ